MRVLITRLVAVLMTVRWRALVPVAFVVMTSGCSSEGPAAPLGVHDASTTPKREASATTTRGASTGASSVDVVAEAEAEIEDVITAWWIEGDDTNDPNDGMEYLVGPIARRAQELRETEAKNGFVSMSSGGAVIEVISVAVDLDAGQATASTCGGFDTNFFDSETLEPIDEPDDPDYQTTSKWELQLTPDGWKIAEWYPSFNTGTPIECTVNGG